MDQLKKLLKPNTDGRLGGWKYPRRYTRLCLRKNHVGKENGMFITRPAETEY